MHPFRCDHRRGCGRDLPAVSIADERDGDLGRVADLLNQALLIRRSVEHALHLIDQRNASIVVGNQAEKTADLSHVALSVDNGHLRSMRMVYL